MAKVISTTVENGIRVTKFDDGTTIQSKDEQTLSQLIAKEHAAVDIVVNPHNDKVFFTCGSITGYVSPAANKKIDAGCDSADLNYAVVKVNDGKWVPTLMVKATNNVKRTFKA